MSIFLNYKNFYFSKIFDNRQIDNLGISAMVLLGVEIAATSVPNKNHCTYSKTDCMYIQYTFMFFNQFIVRPNDFDLLISLKPHI